MLGIFGVSVALTACAMQVKEEKKQEPNTLYRPAAPAAQQMQPYAMAPPAGPPVMQPPSQAMMPRMASQRMANTLGMNFVYIPPGSFIMGSVNEREDNNTTFERQHAVILTTGFFMQTTEVTQGQWKTVMGHNPANFQDCGDHCPVENVSWEEVQEFIRKLNEIEADIDTMYRLPTEAEWEYACRAGNPGKFNNSPPADARDQPNDYDLLNQVGWYYNNANSTSHPVAGKMPNALGLYDMHGNVWEWCQDWIGEYAPGTAQDPKGSETAHDKIMRGGSWSHTPVFCRSANRSWRRPLNKDQDIGFRLVRVARPQPARNDTK